MNFRNKWNLLLFISLVFYILNGFFYVFYANTTFDEGNYLYKSFLYATGAEIPYSSGATWSEYMPGSYYPFGFSQALFGKNFYTARIVSFIFGFLTVVLAFRLTKKMVGFTEATIVVSLLVINSALVQSFSLVAPYSLASFFLLLALYMLISNINNKLKIFLSILFMFVCVFVRSSMLPNYAVFILILMVIFRKLLIPIILSSIVIPIIVLVPFLPGVLRIFINFPIINRMALYLGYPDFYFSKFSGNIDILKVVISFLEFFKYYQVWFISLLSIIIVLFLFKNKVNFKNYFKNLAQKTNYLFPVIIILFILNIIVHFIGSFGHCPRCVIPYFNYFSVLGAVIIAVLLGFFIKRSREEYFSDFVFVISLIIVFFVGTATLSNIFLRPFENTSLKSIERTSVEINRSTKPDELIFSLTSPHYLYLSNRRGFGPLINRWYSLRSSINTVELKNSGLWNVEMAVNWLRNESAWALLPKNYYEALKDIDSEVASLIKKEIDNNFFLYKEFDDVWSGSVDLYKKK